METLSPPWYIGIHLIAYLSADQFLYVMESGSSVQQIRTLNYVFNFILPHLSIRLSSHNGN